MRTYNAYFESDVKSYVINNDIDDDCTDNSIFVIPGASLIGLGIVIKRKRF